MSERRITSRLTLLPTTPVRYINLIEIPGIGPFDNFRREALEVAKSITPQTSLDLNKHGLRFLRTSERSVLDSSDASQHNMFVKAFSVMHSGNGTFLIQHPMTTFTLRGINQFEYVW